MFIAEPFMTSMNKVISSKFCDHTHVSTALHDTDKSSFLIKTPRKYHKIGSYHLCAALANKLPSNSSQILISFVHIWEQKQWGKFI